MVTLIAAWVFADFMSGFFHWIEDRYLRDHWPIIGKYVAQPNSLHHSEPTAFLAGSYWHRNYTSIIPAAVLAAVAAYCGAPAWLVLSFVFLTQANEIHCWGHRKGKLPAVIVLAQETGIIQSTKHHSLHHKSPHEVRYCVMTNWLNPWLDALGFWTAMEKALGLLGAKTK